MTLLMDINKFNFGSCNLWPSKLHLTEWEFLSIKKGNNVIYMYLSLDTATGPHWHSRQVSAASVR